MDQNLQKLLVIALGERPDPHLIEFALAIREVLNSTEKGEPPKEIVSPLQREARRYS